MPTDPAILTQIVLRSLIDPNFQTELASIPWAKEDNNFKIIGDFLRALATIPTDTTGFEEYNAGTIYEDGDFVAYNGNIYQYINNVPSAGVTPGTDVLYWEISSQGQFAHERNKDDYLDFGGIYQVSAQDLYNLLNAGILPEIATNQLKKALLYYGQSMLEVGNSLMAGQDATSAYKDFAQIVTDQLGLIETNQGVSGAGIFRMVKEAYTNLSATGNKSVLMANPDINGIRAAGDNPKTYSKVQEGIKALMLRMNLKTAFAASDGSVTQGGTWTTVTGSSIGDNAGLSLGGNALKSVVSGSTLTFTVNGQNVVIGTFCTDGVSEVSGPFTVTIDGTVMGTWDGDGLADGVSDNDGYNNRITQGVIWFDNLAETNHTVVITTTSTDAVRIDYVGTYNYKNDRRPLIICETTKCTAAGYAILPANATDEIVDKLNAAMLETVNEYSDEFPIYLAKLDEGFDPATFTTDGLHYNDLGHAHAASKVLEKITSVKYLLGKLGIGGTPFAKVDVITDVNDPDLGNVTSWDNRHWKFGPTSSGTGRGLGISYTSGDNAFNLMALAPTVEFLMLRFIAESYVFRIGNADKVKLTNSGDVALLDAVASYYIGDPSTNGSWRRRIDGSDLVDERRESGVWVEKQRIS